MKNLSQIKPSWVFLAISGLLILTGIPQFWSGNFNYWLVTHLIYGVGIILFWFDK